MAPAVEDFAGAWGAEPDRRSRNQRTVRHHADEASTSEAPGFRQEGRSVAEGCVLENHPHPFGGSPTGRTRKPRSAAFPAIANVGCAVAENRSLRGEPHRPWSTSQNTHPTLPSVVHCLPAETIVAPGASFRQKIRAFDRKLATLGRLRALIRAGRRSRHPQLSQRFQILTALSSLATRFSHRKLTAPGGRWFECARLSTPTNGISSLSPIP